jgi:hypothetical protein
MRIYYIYIYTYYLNIWNWFAYIICYCLHSKMTNYLTNTKGYMIHYSHEYLYTCEYSIFITTWIFNTFINNHDYLQIFQNLDFIIVFMDNLYRQAYFVMHTFLVNVYKSVHMCLNVYDICYWIQVVIWSWIL